jgi:hypothetical protein
MQGVQQKIGEINATDRIEQSWFNIVVKWREAMTYPTRRIYCITY